MAGVAKSHCGKAGGMGDIPILENAICRRRGPGHYSPLPWRPSHNQNMTHEGGAFKGGVLHFPSPSLSLLDCPAKQKHEELSGAPWIDSFRLQGRVVYFHRGFLSHFLYCIVLNIYFPDAVSELDDSR